MCFVLIVWVSEQVLAWGLTSHLTIFHSYDDRDDFQRAVSAPSGPLYWNVVAVSFIDRTWDFNVVTLQVIQFCAPTEDVQTQLTLDLRHRPKHPLIASFYLNTTSTDCINTVMEKKYLSFWLILVLKAKQRNKFSLTAILTYYPIQYFSNNLWVGVRVE